MKGLRIIELPPMKMATSGPKDLEELGEFDTWWSNIEVKRENRIYPYDFMYFDGELQKMVWNYILPSNVTDTGDYDVIDFPGGIYVAAISIDGDDGDGEQVYNDIKAWIESSESFEIDESSERHTMFHIITSDTVYEALGYRQLDIYVPIKVK
jgi:hypothetical protein